MPSPGKLRTASLLLSLGLVLLAAINILSGIADYGFLNNNECLYVESARELLRSGHWMIPSLNGLPYLEKPPLMDWLLAGAFRIGGLTEMAARSVPLLASILTALALMRLSPLLGVRGVPGAAGYIYLTSFGVMLMSSAAMPDALLNGLFGVGCVALVAAVRTHSRNLLRLSALLIGLACLVKGFLPLALLVLILAVYLVIKRQQVAPVLKLWRDPLAWLLVCGPLLAWIIAAEISLPGAAQRFVVDEHILRFLGLRQPDDYYSGSVFYYVPRLVLFAFPWIGVLLFSWAAARRNRVSDERDTRHFLWVCVWVPFAFFSVSQAKANYYATLCLPAMAVLTADYLHVLLQKEKRRWLGASIVVAAVLLLALEALGLWAAADAHEPQLIGYPGSSFRMAVAGVLILGMVLLVLAQFGWRKLAALGVGAMIVPVTFQLHQLASAADAEISARAMAGYIRSHFAHAPVFLYRDYEAYGSLPVYLGRITPVIDSRSNDLYFGSRLRPHDASLVTAQTVLDTENALIVVRDEREDAFRRSDLSSRSRAVHRAGGATLYQLLPTRRAAVQR